MNRYICEVCNRTKGELKAVTYDGISAYVCDNCHKGFQPPPSKQIFKELMEHRFGQETTKEIIEDLISDHPDGCSCDYCSLRRERANPILSQ